MMKKINKILFVAGSSILLVQAVFSQSNIPVIAKPFRVITNDTNYNALKYKLPEFVCNGILYNSAIKLARIVVPDEPNVDINLSSFISDSGILKKYKKSYNDLNAKFFIDGEIRISNEQFYISVYATDFINDLISYQSLLKPLSDFQKVIDETCDNLNYQMQSILSGQNRIKKISVRDFDTSFARGVSAKYGKNDNDIYSRDFPSRFLAYNLKNSKSYSILPYGATKDNIPDIVISGKVEYSKNNNCLVRPVIHFPSGDSVVLLEVRDIVQNRDKLLSRLLKNIQSFLDVTIIGGNAGLIKLPDADFSESDYPIAFEKAIEENDLSSAYYYANRLSERFENKKSKSGLMMGIVYYKQGDLAAAIDLINKYLKNDSLDEEANYYAGLSNVQVGRYFTAKSFFNKIDENNLICNSCKDIFFQKGICLYNQDSTQTALAQFLKQVSFDEKIRPETFAYSAFCYRDLNHWPEAESYLLKLHFTDTTNIVYRQYLTDFYNEYAKNLFDSAHFDLAYSYYQESYKLTKTYESMIGQAQSIIRLNKSDNELNELIKSSIQDKITFQNSVYLNLAAFCRTQLDSNKKFIPRYLRTAIFLMKTHEQTVANKTPSVYQILGSTYFRLYMLDSAEYFYNKVKLMDPETSTHYFNLAELQVMENKPDSAIVTLNDFYKRLQSGKFNDVQTDYQLALYYFYLMESELMKNRNYDTEKKALLEIINRKAKGQYATNLFTTWSFRTFYNWIAQNQILSAAVQKGLLENLCIVLKYSGDKNLSCPE